jgi:hypothetical protein
MRQMGGPAARPSFAVALVALAVATAVGCRAAQAVPPAQSYFPLEVGQRWVYDTSFYGPRARSTTSEVAVCRVRDSDQAGRVYLIATCADQDLIEAVFAFEQGHEIAEPLVVNSQGQPQTHQPPEVIARTDMRVGQQWTWDGKVDDVSRKSLYQVANKGKVLTPAGEFDGVRLIVSDQSDGPPAVVERWYATGVGLVKEAGVTFFPGQNGEPVQVELVRLLKEHSVVPVEQIACCQKLPGS